LDNEDYVALRKRLGVTATGSVTFANLPKTAPEGYQEIMMMSRIYFGFADMFGADTPAMLLPPLRKIMPHLSPAGSVSWADATGWHYKGIAPFPGAEMLTPGGGGQAMVGQNALLVSILLPSLNRAREQANRVKCAANMRTIGQGMLLYANENKGKYPPDLGTLITAEELTADVFVCPTESDGAAPRFDKPADAAKWVNENSHYVYLGAGKNTTAAADVILVHEKPDAHGGKGMNVLWGDGHVTFEVRPEAERLIEAQKSAKPQRPRGGGL
jgi:prepilin-type processing-associated H-X9-DG protein